MCPEVAISQRIHLSEKCKRFWKVSEKQKRFRKRRGWWGAEFQDGGSEKTGTTTEDMEEEVQEKIRGIGLQKTPLIEQAGEMECLIYFMWESR